MSNVSEVESSQVLLGTNLCGGLPLGDLLGPCGSLGVSAGSHRASRDGDGLYFGVCAGSQWAGSDGDSLDLRVGAGSYGGSSDCDSLRFDLGLCGVLHGRREHSHPSQSLTLAYLGDSSGGLDIVCLGIALDGGHCGGLDFDHGRRLGLVYSGYDSFGLDFRLGGRLGLGLGLGLGLITSGCGHDGRRLGNVLCLCFLESVVRFLLPKCKLKSYVLASSVLVLVFSNVFVVSLVLHAVVVTGFVGQLPSVSIMLIAIFERYEHTWWEHESWL